MDWCFRNCLILTFSLFISACSIDMIAGKDDGTLVDKEARLKIVPAFRTNLSPEEDPRLSEQFAMQNRAALQELDAQIRVLNSANPKIHHTLVTEYNDNDFKYTDYINDWKYLLEHYSNRIYRNGLQYKKPSGNVLVDVAIKKSGQLHSYNIILSTGPANLDATIKEIIMSNAPYAPLTSKIIKNTDVLHITQMWQFRR